MSLDFDEYQKYSKAIEEMGLSVEDYLSIDKKGNIVANTKNITDLFDEAYKK
jgi:hypothetical protein